MLPLPYQSLLLFQLHYSIYKLILYPNIYTLRPPKYLYSTTCCIFFPFTFNFTSSLSPILMTLVFPTLIFIPYSLHFLSNLSNIFCIFSLLSSISTISSANRTQQIFRLREVFGGQSFRAIPVTPSMCLSSTFSS